MQGRRGAGPQVRFPVKKKLKIARSTEALTLAREGRPVLVLNDQLGWIDGGPGVLDRFERAHAANPLSCWIYGVAR